MINVPTLNVVAKKSLILHLINICSKGGRLKVNFKKISKEHKQHGIKFLKPAINATAPFIGMAVSAKTKNSKVGQATTNILKSISAGRILSLTYMHGRGLRLKVMRNHFKDSLLIERVTQMI